MAIVVEGRSSRFAWSMAARRDRRGRPIPTSPPGRTSRRSQEPIKKGDEDSPAAEADENQDSVVWVVEEGLTDVWTTHYGSFHGEQTPDHEPLDEAIHRLPPGLCFDGSGNIVSCTTPPVVTSKSDECVVLGDELIYHCVRVQTVRRDCERYERKCLEGDVVACADEVECRRVLGEKIDENNDMQGDCFRACGGADYQACPSCDPYDSYLPDKWGIPA